MKNGTQGDVTTIHFPDQDLKTPSTPSKKYTVYSEKEPYDFVAERNVEKPTNLVESTGYLITGVLGGGVLGIHEGYMKCGLWTALGITIVFGLIMTYTLHFLVRSAQTLYQRLHIPQMSYPDLAEISIEMGPFPVLRKFKKSFRYSVDVLICTNLFGACCVYQIIIAKTIQQLVEGLDPTAPEDLSGLSIYVICLFIPILLMCMITAFKYLAPFTLVADFFIAVCVIGTVIYSLREAPPLSTMPAWNGSMGFFEFSGMVIFGLEGIGVLMPIENNMRNPRDFPKVLCSGMTIVTTFLSLVGFFGYWGYGDNAMSPVTLHFPTDVFPTILKCLTALTIFITFTLNFWAPFNLVWYYIAKKHEPKKHWLWERVYRTAFITFITIIAIVFPNLRNLMGLLGAICIANLAFIFPAVIETLVIWENPGLGRYNWRLWKNILIGILGVLLFIAGTYSNLVGLIENF